MTKEVMNWNDRVGGKKAERIPCPDGIEGCLVGHYKVIEEALKQEEDEPICRMRVGQDSVTWYDDKGSVTMHVDSSNKVTNNLQPKQERKPLTDDEFLELLLRKGNSELLHYTTFVGGSIQMQGKIGLLKSAKVIKEFIEEWYGIKE